MSQNEKTDTLRVQLENLRKEYVHRLPSKIQELEKSFSEVKENNWHRDYLKKFLQQIHTLAGSSGTFGYINLSNESHILEIYIKSIIRNQIVLTEIQRKQLENIFGGVRQAAKESRFLPDFQEEEVLTPPSIPFLENQQLIYLVEDDLQQAQNLAIQISHFGYKVFVFKNIPDFMKEVRKTPPALVIIEINFPDDPYGGIKAIAQIQSERDSPLPVIFISAQTDLYCRLESVRAGGKAFLSKPFGIEDIIDHVDHLISFDVAEPYRILILEDDPSTATQYSQIIQESGMISRVLDDPYKTLDMLIEFKADLILMDLYMNINGLELASLLRQHESFMSLPIVFISTESDPEKQRVAIGMGIDDFITKPVKAHNLVLTLRSRASRSRMLHSFMEKDSLTGLYNHTTLREKLAIEVTRALRNNAPLSFVMVDLDHFKQVNDTYGHLVGDRVIKSLSRLLKQRLRRTDILGRYGGEEFAILLPDTRSDQALKVMEELREAFSNVQQVAGKTIFTSTFSCGIASVEGFKTAIELNDAADKALYKAKRSGRNCVKMASPDEIFPEKNKP